METIFMTNGLNVDSLPIRKNCQAAVLLDGADYPADSEAEYIADYGSMLKLEGSRMKRRRSLIRQFKVSNNDWCFNKILPDGIDIAFEVERLWQRDEAGGEAAFVRRCFRNFARLELIGGILYSGGLPVGYSLSAPCGSTGALILVIRARPVPAGVTAMLYRQTALLLKEQLPELRSINLGCCGGEPEDKTRVAYCSTMILSK